MRASNSNIQLVTYTGTSVTVSESLLPPLLSVRRSGRYWQLQTDTDIYWQILTPMSESLLPAPPLCPAVWPLLTLGRDYRCSTSLQQLYCMDWALLYSTLLYSTLLPSTLLYSIYSTLLYCSLLYCIDCDVLFSTFLLYCSLLYELGCTLLVIYLLKR